MFCILNNILYYCTKLKTNIMRTRYDYRNDYKGWSKKQISTQITVLQDKLLDNLGICESNADNYLKRIVYLEDKLTK